MQQNETFVVPENSYDIAIFGSAGVRTRLDVGFVLKSERTPATGSILGSVVYDTTRSNLNAAEAATENHEPGLPGIMVSLYRLDGTTIENGQCNRKCDFVNGDVGYICNDEGNINKGKDLKCSRYYVGYEGDSKPFPITIWESTDARVGDISVGIGQVAFDFAQKTSPRTLVRTDVTAEFESPKNCLIRDKDGNPILFGHGQNALPDPTAEGTPCIETPMLRNQVGGFTKTDGHFQFDNLEPGLYAMAIDIPMDLSGEKPAYKVRTEHDVNSYESDVWLGNQCGANGCPTCPSN